LIWARAEGCRVWDTEGREYIDLTGGFGVAVLGHNNPKIATAIAEAPVVHALGDLAEAEVTQRFRDALPWPAKLGVTGEDAVEIALRTALLATGKPGMRRSWRTARRRRDLHRPRPHWRDVARLGRCRRPLRR
jgi:4-aminobutyrate aminotransferase-like enzyme